MKSFVVNAIIIVLVMAVYYFDLLDFFTTKYALWIILGVIFLLFLAALKILGNPFAKDNDYD